MGYTIGNRENTNGPIEEGKVALQVMDSKFTCDKYSSKGNKMTKLHLKQVARFTGGQWIRLEGGTVFDQLVFIEKSFWHIDGFVSSSGIAAKQGKGEGDEINLKADALIGVIVYAEIVHVPSDNPKYPINAEVSNYIKADSEFHPSQMARGKAADPGPEPPVEEDDDCPF